MKTESKIDGDDQATRIVRRELYAKASIPPEGETAPRSTMDFRSSDATLDRYREVISVSGWKLDSYRKNPVVQNAHSYWSLADTIGKSLITEIRGVVSLSSARASTTLSRPTGEGQPARHRLGEGGGEGPYLFQRVQFAVDENPMAKLAYGLYKGGFLSAVSVGFIPLRWEDGSQEKGYRRKYLEQELLEVSAVSIPANPNALVLAVRAGAIQRFDVNEAADFLKSVANEPDTELRPLIEQMRQIVSRLKSA